MDTRDTYNPKAFRQYRTHPIIRQWNADCSLIPDREKAMKRAAGVYKPGSEHYPYPEPNTQEIDRKITAYFTAITKRSHARLCATIDPDTYYTVYGYTLEQ